MPGVKGKPFSGNRCNFSKKRGYKLRAQNRARKQKEEEEKFLESKTPKTSYVIQGRRVVDLDYIKTQMICANKKCRNVLNLFNLSGEKVIGLASVFTFTCPLCFTFREVRSSTHKIDGSHYTYDVNCKAAIGMLDSGNGATHVNTFLSALNIPVFNCCTLKRHERIVGNSIVRVAEKSFLEAALQEKELTLKLLSESGDDLSGVQLLDDSINFDHPIQEIGVESVVTSTPQSLPHTPSIETIVNTESATPSDSYSVEMPNVPDVLNQTAVSTESERLYKEKVATFTAINASADMQWFKRGNGSRYDSLDGQCNLMGNETRKVLGVVIKMKDCSKCQKSKTGKCGKQTCNKNWTGSAKSMESAATLELVAENKILDTAAVRVAELTGDEDSSTAAKLRNNLGDAVTRSSDILHAKKCLSRQLYALQKFNSKLTSAAIKYILRCASTAIAQSSAKNPQALADALNSIPHHAFGIHTSCGSWCKAYKSPNYTSKYLVKSLGTPNCPLHHALVKTMKKFANKAPQLCKKRSSQKNESFNFTSITKAPKYIHYGSSDSLIFRVHAAAAQKNCDVEYILLVNEDLKMSPGVNTIKYRAALNRKRKREKEEKEKPENKRRRNLAQEKRNTHTTNQEKTEGTTYQSGMGFEDTVAEKTSRPPVERTLTYTAPPLCKLPHVTEKDCDIIYFDIETTGKSYKKYEIIQIAARSESREFNIFIKPVKVQKISEPIVNLTGISYIHGNMFFDNQFVPSVYIRQALTQFCDFLELHKNPIVAAHCVTFDLRFILKYAHMYGMQDRFTSAISGAVNTCTLFKNVYKTKEEAPENYSLITVVTFALGPQFNFKAHSAHNDVMAMKSVCDKLELNNVTTVAPTSFTIASFIEREKGFTMFESLVELTIDANFPSRVLSKLARNGWNAASVKSLVVEGNLENTQSILKSVLKKDTEVTVKWLHCNIK